MPAGCVKWSSGVTGLSAAAISLVRKKTKRVPGKRARSLVSAGCPRTFHAVLDVDGGLCIVITGGGGDGHRYLRRGGSPTDAHTPHCSRVLVNDDGRSDGGTTVQSTARVPYRVVRQPDHYGRRRQNP